MRTATRLCKWSCWRELPCGSMEKAQMCLSPDSKVARAQISRCQHTLRRSSHEGIHQRNQAEGNTGKLNELDNAQICYRETRSPSHHNKGKQLPQEYIGSPPSLTCWIRPNKLWLNVRIDSIFVEISLATTLRECHGCSEGLRKRSCRRELPCRFMGNTQTCHSTNSKVARTETSRTEDTLRRSLHWAFPKKAQVVSPTSRWLLFVNRLSGNYMQCKPHANRNLRSSPHSLPNSPPNACAHVSKARYLDPTPTPPRTVQYLEPSVRRTQL